MLCMQILICAHSLKASITRLEKASEVAQTNILFQAAADGDLDLVKHEVLDVKEDVNGVGNLYQFEGYYKMTPLAVAANNRHIQVVKFLLDQNSIDVNFHTTNGPTALMLAAAAGDKQIVEKLLQRGADVNLKCCGSRTGCTPDGCTPDGCTPDGCTPVNAEGSRTGVGELQWNPGVSALWIAAKNGHVECVRALLRYKVELDAADKQGDTALMMAAMFGHVEVVKELLDAGANMYKHDRSSCGQMVFTAAGYAAAKGHIDVLRLLLNEDRKRSRFFVCPEQIERLREMGAGNAGVERLLNDVGMSRTPRQSATGSMRGEASLAANGPFAEAWSASAVVNGFQLAHSGDESV
jgi:ankyrin repeat protein